MPFPRTWPKKNLVEAFPNAYLGVLLPESEYLKASKIQRGKKFDWLYDRCLSLDLFTSMVTTGYSKGTSVLEKLHANRNHDERAALICLLTAAGVSLGSYTAIGQAQSGYFFLPAWRHWQPWAKEAIRCECSRAGCTEFWVDGRCLEGPPSR